MYPSVVAVSSASNIFIPFLAATLRRLILYLFLAEFSSATCAHRKGSYGVFYREKMSVGWVDDMATIVNDVNHPGLFPVLQIFLAEKTKSSRLGVPAVVWVNLH